jgi:hypothetical protein
MSLPLQPLCFDILSNPKYMLICRVCFVESQLRNFSLDGLGAHILQDLWGISR